MKTIGCLVNTFLRPSEGFIFEQIVNMRGYSVEVLARDRQNQSLFPYEKVNTLSGFSRFAYTLFRDTTSFENIVARKDIRLLHAHFGVEGAYALPLQRHCNLPLVVTFHGQDITRLPKLTLYPPAWLNYWLSFNDLKRSGALFLAVSNYIKQMLVNKGFPAERILTHYLGINTDVEVIRTITREHIIVTAGRLVEKKGIEYIIRAMRNVVLAYPNAKLLIVGDGPLRQYLENLCQKLMIDKNVIFYGWQPKDKLFHLLRSARLFALTSISASDGDAEGLGMVFLEAMVHGLPVIGSNHGGIPDVVKDSVNGFLVPERSIVELADKIKILFADSALAETMGKRGRQMAVENFNIHVQIKKLENLYKDLL